MFPINLYVCKIDVRSAEPYAPAIPIEYLQVIVLAALRYSPLIKLLDGHCVSLPIWGGCSVAPTRRHSQLTATPYRCVSCNRPIDFCAGRGEDTENGMQPFPALAKIRLATIYDVEEFNIITHPAVTVTFSAHAVCEPPIFLSGDIDAGGGGAVLGGTDAVHCVYLLLVKGSCPLL